MSKLKSVWKFIRQRKYLITIGVFLLIFVIINTFVPILRQMFHDIKTFSGCIT